MFFWDTPCLRSLILGAVLFFSFGQGLFGVGVPQRVCREASLSNFPSPRWSLVNDCFVCCIRCLFFFFFKFCN
uniref:Uncharacterized protein n=1 Tax=Ixodes scapularis TaxID=6945 RepID=A0A4D5RWD6_IXOSC